MSFLNLHVRGKSQRKQSQSIHRSPDHLTLTSNPVWVAHWLSDRMMALFVPSYDHFHRVWGLSGIGVFWWGSDGWAVSSDWAAFPSGHIHIFTCVVIRPIQLAATAQSKSDVYIPVPFSEKLLDARSKDTSYAQRVGPRVRLQAHSCSCCRPCQSVGSESSTRSRNLLHKLSLQFFRRFLNWTRMSFFGSLPCSHTTWSEDLTSTSSHGVATCEHGSCLCAAPAPLHERSRGY